MSQCGFLLTRWAGIVQVKMVLHLARSELVEETVLRGFLYLPRLLGILCCGRGGGGCRCSFMLTRCLPRLLGVVCCGRGFG